MKDAAIDIIARVSGKQRDALGLDVELVADLGLNSLQAFELVVELEEGLGIRLDEDSIRAIRTVGDVLNAVGRAGPAC